MWYVINAKLRKPKLGSFYPDVTTNGNRNKNLTLEFDSFLTIIPSISMRKTLFFGSSECTETSLQGPIAMTNHTEYRKYICPLKNCDAQQILQAVFMNIWCLYQRSIFSYPLLQFLGILWSSSLFGENLPYIRRRSFCFIIWRQLIFVLA